jgi:DNA repair protein RadC
MIKITPVNLPDSLRPGAPGFIYPDGSLVTCVELTYKSRIKASQRPLIRNSRSAYEFFLRHWDMTKIELLEHFKGMYLNRAGRVLAIANISAGGITTTTVDCRHIMAIALKLNAISIIACHNHPGGNPTPSKADNHLTEKLKGCGILMDIDFLDHIIICQDGYFSYADEGLLSLHSNRSYLKKVAED